MGVGYLMGFCGQPLVRLTSGLLVDDKTRERMTKLRPDGRGVVKLGRNLGKGWFYV